MKAVRLVLIAALAAAGAVHAQNIPGAQARAAAAAHPKSTMPLVEGEIRKLDAATGLIVLKHGDVPNLGMPAMTMGYQIAAKAMLSGFKVGDTVRFQAEMINDTATVTELRKR